MELTKSFASLTPRLLARKGGARPAMRSQLVRADESLVPGFDPEFGSASDNDLGWNDMGESPAAETVPAEEFAAESGQVVAIRSDVVVPRRRQRGSALKNGRRAAFTLRLDAERHLKLRLACTLDERSAQQLVTDALDRLLANMPEIDALADQVGKRRKS